MEGADPSKEDPRRGSGRQRGRRSAGLRRAEAGSTSESETATGSRATDRARRALDLLGPLLRLLGLRLWAIYSGPVLVPGGYTMHTLVSAAASPSRLRPCAC